VSPIGRTASGFYYNRWDVGFCECSSDTATCGTGHYQPWYTCNFYGTNTVCQSGAQIQQCSTLTNAWSCVQQCRCAWHPVQLACVDITSSIVEVPQSYALRWTSWDVTNLESQTTCHNCLDFSTGGVWCNDVNKCIWQHNGIDMQFPRASLATQQCQSVVAYDPINNCPQPTFSGLSGWADGSIQRRL
jgi:hypothetical protein